MRTALLIACVALSGCATSTIATGAAILSGANYSVDAYCRLTPEGRAAVRERLGIRRQLIVCPP